MGMAIGITRRDLDAAGLRRAARVSSDSDPARRMLALALVLEGRSRTEAARTCGMDRQTLVDWVHRYNAAGLGGLKDRPLPGRAARLDCAAARTGGGLGASGPRPCEGWGCTLAADRPCAQGRGRAWGKACRTHYGQGSAQARVQPCFGQAASSQGGRTSPGGA